jgi:hypothetical protein
MENEGQKTSGDVCLGHAKLFGRYFLYSFVQEKIFERRYLVPWYITQMLTAKSTFVAGSLFRLVTHSFAFPLCLEVRFQRLTLRIFVPK